ncbi:hypothetical protein SH449x_003443 [Pirellulaceae bacterium SH449]
MSVVELGHSMRGKILNLLMIGGLSVCVGVYVLPAIPLFFKDGPLELEVSEIPTALIQMSDSKIMLTIHNRTRGKVAVLDARTTCSCLSFVDVLEGIEIKAGGNHQVNLHVRTGMSRDGLSSTVLIRFENEHGELIAINKHIGLDVEPIVDLSSNFLEFGKVTRDSKVVEKLVFSSRRNAELDVFPLAREHTGFVISEVRKISDNCTEVSIEFEPAQVDSSVSNWYGNLSFRTSLTGNYIHHVSARVTITRTLTAHPQKIVFTRPIQRRTVFVSQSASSSLVEEAAIHVTASDPKLIIESFEKVDERCFRIDVLLAGEIPAEAYLEVSTQDTSQKISIPVSLWKG